jgi:hypothetical protein
MPIDLATEKVINLREAAALLGRGRNGRPMHISTLVRAITRGSPDGVRLEALKAGRRWLTTTEAVQRWLEAATPRSERGGTGIDRSPSGRRRAAAQEEKELGRRGV